MTANLTKRAAGLNRAEQAYLTARERVKVETQKAQASCKHPVVYEASLCSSGSNPNGRICPSCGYEEHAWWWPTCTATNNDRRGSFQSKLNGELVVKVDSVKFYSCRPRG